VATPPTWVPTVAQVAGYIPTRTKELRSTRYLDTFTDATRPTAVQVTAIAADAARRVKSAVGPEMPERLEDSAGIAAAILAAAWIERAYFPEQLETDRSAYDALMAEYDKELALLISATAEGTEDPGDGGTVITSGMPAYGFPAVGAPASGVRW
jgi:hypothetical protein